MNDNDPVWGTFNPDSQPYEIKENDAIGTTVVTIVATDADSGSDGDITYSISMVISGG